LLSTGNESDRIEAYRAFRGRDPDVKYIMKKRGFPVPGEDKAVVEAKRPRQ
jgi:peptidyl-dipeptidase Dcp